MTFKKSKTKAKTKEAVVISGDKTIVKEVILSETSSDLHELISDAKKHIDGIFSVQDESAELLQVQDWIKLNPVLQEVMGDLPGIPCGMITQACGPKDSGKTTFATEALSSAQRDGGIAILLDTEKKYSLKRAKIMGLNVKDLIIIQAKTIEEAFNKFVVVVNIIKNKGEYVDKEGEVLDSHAYDKLDSNKKKKYRKVLKYAGRKVCVVWDSLGATPCEAELDDSKTDFSMNAAKAIKGQMRKLLAYISDMKVAFVIINQVYANTNSFGKKTTPYGGSGPEYHSAIILEFARLGRVRPDGVKSPEPFCGIKTKIECTKNHVGQPFREVELAVDYKGFVVDRSPEYAPKELLEERKEVEGESEEVVSEREETIVTKKRTKPKAS